MVHSHPMDVAEVADEFLVSYRRKKKGKRTLTYYKQVLDYLIAWLDEQGKLHEFSAALVDEFLAELAEGWVLPGKSEAWYRRYASRAHERTDETLNKYARAIRAFANFSLDRGYLPPEAVLDRRGKSLIKLTKVNQPHHDLLTGDDILMLFEHVSTVSTDRDKLILSLFLTTGIRASEALNLKYGDISVRALTTPPERFETLTNGDRLIMIRKGKGEKPREVPLMRQTHRQLFLTKDDYGPDDNVLRTDPFYLRVHEDKPLTYQGLRRALQDLEKRIYRATGRRVRCNPHNLRRTFATMFIHNGGNAAQLQKLMGHAHIETTMSYVRLVADDLVDAAERFGTLKGLDID